MPKKPVQPTDQPSNDAAKAGQPLLAQRLAKLGAWGKTFTPLALVGLLLAGLVAFNVLLSFLTLRFDITEGKVYTLSQGSRKIVASMQDITTLKLFYSSSTKNIPAQVEIHARRVRELLQEFSNASGGKVKLEVYDPKPDTDDEEWAHRYGLTGARLPNGGNLYLGVVALAIDRESQIRFFDPRRAPFLEYDISHMLSRVNREKRPSIGIVSSLPVSGTARPAPGAPPPEWTFIRELRKSYGVRILSQQNLFDVPQGTDLLIVMHPKEKGLLRMAYAIDQYVVGGGKVVLMLDPHSRTEPAFRYGFNIPTASDMKPLLSAWGIAYSSTAVAADLLQATTVNTQQGPASYPIWITIGPNGRNTKHPITSQLEEITLIDSGMFASKKDNRYTFTPLLYTSKQATQVEFSTARLVRPIELAKSLKPDGKQRVLAGLLSGTFRTAFPDGRPKEPLPKKGDKSPVSEPPKNLRPHLSKGKQAGLVLLLGDVDFISDGYSVRQGSFLGASSIQPINDNQVFIQNAVEYMTGDPALISIRSRGRISRPFTLVQDIQAQAALRYQKQEALLSQRLQQVQQRLEEAEKTSKDGRTLILGQKQIEEIERFRTEEVRTRTALREVRKLLREDIESLGNRLLIFNALFIPLLVAMAGFWVGRVRARRRTT